MRAPASLLLPLLLCAAARAAEPAASSGVEPRAVLAFLSAYAHELAGRHAQAASGYKAAIRFDPASAVLWAHRGRAQMADGRLADADESLARAIGLAPAYAEARQWRAELHLARKDERAALAELSEVVRLLPESVEARLDLIRTLVRAGQTARAIEEFRILLKERSEPPLEFEFADLLAQAGRRAEAASLLRDRVVRQPDDREARMRLVRHLVADGEWKAALAQQEELVRRFPADVDARKTHALLLRERGDHAGAAKLLESVVSERPGDEDARSWLVEAYRQAGRSADAVRHLEAAVAADPGAARLVWQLALLLRDTGEPDRAFEVVRRALSREANAEAALLHTLEGILHADRKRFAEAIPPLRRAVALEPENEPALFQLAVAYDRTGDFARAREWFYRTLKTNPRHAQAANYLGYSLADRNEKLDEAVRLIRVALAVEPDNGAYVDSLGWAYFRLGQLDEARRELERAIALLARSGGESVQDPVVWEHLGDVCAKLGDESRAKDAWNTALRLDPGNRGLQDKLAAR